MTDPPPPDPDPGPDPGPCADDDDDNADTDTDADGGARRTRLALLSVTGLCVFLYAGAFFGWGPMQLMLEAGGAFSGRCGEGGGDGDGASSSSSSSCPAQTAALLNVQLVAQLTMVASPVLGAASDRYGGPAMVRFAALCGGVGMALLVLAAALSIDAMLYGAFVSLGLMSQTLGLGSMAVGVLFLGRARDRAISGLNALLDAGAVTYLGLWKLDRSTGLDLPEIAGLYLGLFVLCAGGALVLWGRVVPEGGGGGGGGAVGEEDGEPGREGRIEEDGEPDQGGEADRGGGEADRGGEGGGTASAAGPAGPSPAPPGEAPPIPYVLVADRPALEQFRSGQFLALASFFAFHQSRNLWVLTTSRDFLAFLGDDETGNAYLAAFTLLTPASVVGLPFIDAILRRYGYSGALQFVNALGMVQGIIQVASGNLNVQILGFVVYTFYRCFLFSASFSCLPEFLGPNVLGRGYGLLILAGGICSLCNLVLANVAVQRLGGNFFVPNLIYTILCLPCVFLAARLGRGLRREREEISRRSSSKEIGSP